MTVHVKGHYRNEQNGKYTGDLKTGNVFSMHMIKNQLKHGTSWDVGIRLRILYVLV